MAIGQFPHCDSRILHKGDCQYCDAHPEWQELREAWGIAFTGQLPAGASLTVTPRLSGSPGTAVGTKEHSYSISVPADQWTAQLPCPADFNRPPNAPNDHRNWGGNVATSAKSPTNTAENETWGTCIGESVDCDEETGLVGEGSRAYTCTGGHHVGPGQYLRCISRWHQQDGPQSPGIGVSSIVRDGSTGGQVERGPSWVSHALGRIRNLRKDPYRAPWETDDLLAPSVEYVTPIGSRHTTDPTDPRLGHGVDTDPVGQNEVYLVLSEEERAKGFVRPVRRSYRHLTCGSVTTMGMVLAETFARDFRFYGATLCVNCAKHLPVGEFVWEHDGTKVGS